MSDNGKEWNVKEVDLGETVFVIEFTEKGLEPEVKNVEEEKKSGDGLKVRIAGLDLVGY